MPLFECSTCHTIDNTALTNWASRHIERLCALCSECDPEIATWHGEFERKQVAEFRQEFPHAQLIGDPGYCL